MSSPLPLARGATAPSTSRSPLGLGPALNADVDAREGADLAELTCLLNLSGWPPGMRVIVHRERPHPGAQLRFDDVDGYRLTAFATNTALGTRDLNPRASHVPLLLEALGLETRTAAVTPGLVAPTCKNQNDLEATGADQPQTGPT